MLKQLLKGIGLGGGEAPPPPPPSAQGFAPYKEPSLNQLYNLLFCDDINLFRSAMNQPPQGPWVALTAATPSRDELRAIADDESQESRLRVLAYNRLRQMNEPVPPKKLLGVVVEVGLDDGLDVLAAYVDERVRYINQTGRMSIFEGAPPEVVAKVGPLIEVSQRVVEQIGPWNKDRLPPPSRGMIRMNFLVSDGLYFGQGTLQEMQNEKIGGPIVAASVNLLNAVVEAAVKQQK